MVNARKARERARLRAERAAANRVELRARRQRIAAVVGAVVAVLAVAGVGSYLAVGTGHAHKPAAAATTSPSPSASTNPASYGGTPVCHYKKESQYKVKGERSFGLPPDRKAHGHPVATIRTNRGTITVALDAKAAPCTVNSFEFLAGKGYFTHTPCQRLTDYTAEPADHSKGLRVLQCGDPTGTGYGSPGYVFPSENLAHAKYPVGTLAMANSGSADTNGSQFFLVYGPTTLPASYTPFGRITSGLSVLRRIAAHGEVPTSGQPDGRPKEKVEIETVHVTGAKARKH